MSDFPDIGENPLYATYSSAEEALELALDRLRKAVAVQQKEVPNQTMLAWRADVSRLIDEYTWRKACMDLRGLGVPKELKTTKIKKLLEEIKE